MGDTDDSIKPKRIVFVTVGTTCFDGLVRVVDTPEIKRELFNSGYSHLLVQMGRGSYIPTKSSGEDWCLTVDYFTFSSSIADNLRSASLVISHAGIFGHFNGKRNEILLLENASHVYMERFKPLIVVVNDDLMDNHQSELAEELAERKHLFCASPQTLFHTIKSMSLETLIPYHPGDARPVAKLINRFLGYPDD